MDKKEDEAVFSIKNISSKPLNIPSDELTERFIRGDVSRTTEGSGLGLSIAKNLTTLMGGTFDIILDGDLFKVMITFPLAFEWGLYYNFLWKSMSAVSFSPPIFSKEDISYEVT